MSMSVWIEGHRYNYYGRTLLCVRRYFEGCLELVDLASEEALRLFADGATAAESPTFTRTARALAPCVLPRVTRTLGGVTRPDRCDHRYCEHFEADAGPNAGRVCCALCGGAVDAPDFVTAPHRARPGLAVDCPICGASAGSCCEYPHG
jgi:hypothetical protein